MSEVRSPYPNGESTTLETRLVPLPDPLQRMIPEELDPSKVLVVSYDVLMGVIREMAGSSLAPFRAYSAKLTAAIRAEAWQEFQDRLDAAHADGFRLGQEETIAMGTAQGSFDSSLDRVYLTPEGVNAVEELD